MKINKNYSINLLMQFFCVQDTFARARTRPFAHATRGFLVYLIQALLKLIEKRVHSSLKYDDILKNVSL